MNVLLDMIDEQESQAWFVGGLLRDLLLKREVTDVDLVFDQDPTRLAKDWAREVCGRWFWLDPERKQSRVLLRTGLIVDFVPLRSKTIAEDLLLRDFTLNAMAYPIVPPFYSVKHLDPTGGAEDLQNATLRCCSTRAFSDDPLRMLKGIRHAVTLNMQFDAECFEQLQLKSGLIQKVAGERIRDELGKTLASPRAIQGVRLLLRSGLLAALFGPAGPAWNEAHALETLELMQKKILSLQRRVERDLSLDDKNESFPQKALFLLARLLELYAPENLPDLLHRRLRLSRYQQRLVLAVQEPAEIDRLLAAPKFSSTRQQALAVEQSVQTDTEQLIYFSLCDERFPFDQAILLSHAFRTHQKLGRIPDLISGDRLSEFIPGLAGSDIGEWQKKIKNAEIAGEITTEEQVENWLEKQLSI